MPLVWIREKNTVFHKAQECIHLNKRPGRGEQHDLLELELSELTGVRPCQTCYPDYKPLKIYRRHCPTCNKSRISACRHNGGIPVVITYKTGYVGLLRDPGEEVRKTIYVWPDRLYLYEQSA